MLGVGVYMFSKELLNRYRDAVVDKKRGPKLRKTLEKISEKGYVIGRKHYKKVPHGYDTSDKNAQLLLYNGLTAMVETKIPKAFYSNAIMDYSFSHYENMVPLHKWLREAIE